MFGGLALRTRRILHGFCMVFACGTACAFFCMTRTACTVLRGFACGTACAFFCMTRTACAFFCMTRTACTVLHGFCMWNSLHVFCMTRTACTVLHGFLHVAQPRAPPLFFSCQAVRRFILENLAVGSTVKVEWLAQLARPMSTGSPNLV